MVMEFAPQVRPAHPPQQPHVPQPGFEHLDPPPPPPPAQQPVVVAAEVLEAVNQTLKKKKERKIFIKTFNLNICEHIWNCSSGLIWLPKLP